MTSVSEQGMPPPANGAAHHETVLEVGTERIARIYAEALLRAAAKKDQADEILEELQALLDKVFKADPQFEAFLASGAVDRKRKAAVLDSVFAGRASDLPAFLRRFRKGFGGFRRDPAPMENSRPALSNLLR